MLYFIVFFVAPLLFLAALGVHLWIIKDREKLDKELKEARDEYDKELTTLRKWSKGVPTTIEERRESCNWLRKELHKELRKCDFYVKLDLEPTTKKTKK